MKLDLLHKTVCTCNETFVCVERFSICRKQILSVLKMFVPVIRNVCVCKTVL